MKASPGPLRLLTPPLPCGQHTLLPWPGASLRLVRYGCDDAAQRFRYQGKSLYSQAAASYINMRELRLLRAHGDPPGGDLAPLRRETRATRVPLEESSSSLIRS